MLKLKCKTIQDMKELRKNCTGCAVCSEVCPNNAIKMEFTIEGDYPQINNEKCIKCGICIKKCPALNIKFDNNKEPQSYAVWAKDLIRKESSSGGMFTILAEKIIEEGGFVCGAAYNSNLDVEHILVNSKVDLKKLKGSKYVQSNTQKVYSQVALHLKEGMKVLYSGCPCQIAGLYSYLGKKYENLITVDILCYCAPSKSIFKQFIRENYNFNQLKKCEFRNKRFGWDTSHFIAVYKDKSEHISNITNNAYERAFHMGLLRRSSCISCSFSNFPRQGDLTLGDFWNIEEYDSSWNDNKGTSLVLINNLKGLDMFEKVKPYMKRCELIPYTVSHVNRFNPSSEEKIPYRGAMERFHYLCRKNYTIEKAVDLTLNYQYDIAILCNWSMPNYGAHLTHYALYTVVTSLGLEALMVERIPSRYGKSLENPPLFKVNPYPEWSLHKPFETKTDAASINNICNTVLVGSDQNWNRYMSEAVGDFWFLDFVHNDKKKISYASSFGFDAYQRDKESCKRTAHFLKKFDAVSVREKSGVDICKNYLGTDAECVLDPVFLCEMDYYEKLILRSQKQNPNNFIFMYILDIEDKEDVLQNISFDLNLQSVYVTDAYDNELKLKNWTLPVERNVSVEDWLNYVKSSKFVITDSYHGVCFSILFKKPFIAIINENRGAARFTSLLSLLGLMNRAVTNAKDIPNKLKKLQEIDYDEVYKILNQERNKSMNWLKKALLNNKEKHISDFDICNEMYNKLEIKSDNMYEHMQRIDNRVENIDKHVVELDSYTVNIDKHLAKLDSYVVNIDKHVAKLDFREFNIDKHLSSLEKNVINIDKEVILLNKKVIKLEEELLSAIQNNNVIKKSFSYKIGKLITYIPRKLIHLFFKI